MYISYYIMASPASTKATSICLQSVDCLTQVAYCWAPLNFCCLSFKLNFHILTDYHINIEKVFL